MYYVNNFNFQSTYFLPFSGHLLKLSCKNILQEYYKYAIAFVWNITKTCKIWGKIVTEQVMFIYKVPKLFCLTLTV